MMDKSTPFTHPPEGYGRERRIAELEAKLEALEEAARAYSKNVGHSRKCTFLMVVQQQVSGKPCICGHDALAALL